MFKNIDIDIKDILFIIVIVVMIALEVFSGRGKDDGSQAHGEELNYEDGYSEGFDDGMEAFKEKYASILEYADESAHNDNIDDAIYEIRDYVNGESDYSREEINELCDLLLSDRQDLFNALKKID